MDDETKNETGIEVRDEKDVKLSLQKQDQALIDDIVEETDVDKLKDLTHLFNAFQAKRQVLRVNALNEVQDALIEQMVRRLKETPHNFDNKDIANWMKVVQLAMDSSQKNIEGIDTIPAITYQQNNQLNIHVDAASQLSKDSRDKITSIIQQIMNSTNNTGSTPVLEEELEEDDEQEDSDDGRDE